MIARLMIFRQNSVFW